MPDYRKKKRSRFSLHPKGRGAHSPKAIHSNDIDMTPDSNKKTAKGEKNINMRVVQGKKLEKKKKIKLFAAVVAIILVIVCIFQLILPAGIIQTLKNSITLIGSGSYPLELDSSDTLDVKPMGHYYYILSDTQLSAYSNSGKKLFDFAHGFENPILKTSKWGAILFNQGRTDVHLFTLKGIENTIETENNIITATISNKGSYAIVTESKKYASSVSVYNKYGKNLYEWYSAENIVNNVVIAPNSKKIAVSTFNTSGGEFSSRVSVFNFKSANADFSLDFSNTLVYDLSSDTSSRFCVATSNGLQFIKWSNYKKTDYSNDYNLLMLRTASHGTVAVWGRESDPNDNKVSVFSKAGKLDFEFQFKGIITDIRLFGGNIYCMSDTEIYLIDKKGTVLRKTSSGFGGVKTIVTGSNSVLSVTDNRVEKIKLEQELK